jgi:hypothetical protein
LWHFGSQQGFSQQAFAQQGLAQQGFSQQQAPQTAGLQQQAGSGQQHFACAQALALHPHDAHSPQLQSAKPSMRSNSSPPNPELHKATLTNIAPRILWAFIRNDSFQKNWVLLVPALRPQTETGECRQPLFSVCSRRWLSPLQPAKPIRKASSLLVGIG